MNYKYKAIVFDAGGVIFEDDYWKVKIERRYRRFCDLSKLRVPPLSLQEFSNLTEFISVIYQTTPGIDFGDLLKNIYSDLGVDYTVSSPKTVKGIVREGVISTLSKLKRIGFLLCILTDSPLSGPVIERKYAKVLSNDNGDPLIDYYLSSYDIGATKPSRIVYDFLKSKLNCRSNEILMVAHDLDEIIGARVSGKLNVVAVNVHSAEELLAKKWATYYMHDITELINVVR